MHLTLKTERKPSTFSGLFAPPQTQPSLLAANLKLELLCFPGIRPLNFGTTGCRTDKALLKQLMFHALSDEVAIAAIMSAVMAGQMTQSDKAKVIDTISSRLSTSADDKASSGRSVKQSLQTHMHMFNYLTPTDWAYLAGTASVQDRCSYMASRLIGECRLLLGCFCVCLWVELAG